MTDTMKEFHVRTTQNIKEYKKIQVFAKDELTAMTMVANGIGSVITNDKFYDDLAIKNWEYCGDKE